MLVTLWSEDNDHNNYVFLATFLEHLLAPPHGESTLLA